VETAQEGTQIAGARFQGVWVVPGKAKHAVAMTAKEAAYLLSRVTMIDE